MLTVKCRTRLEPRNPRFGSSDAHKGVIGPLDGKSFGANRSNDVQMKNAVSTFAYRIMLNKIGLRGNEHETWRRCASIRVFSGTEV
jgi:hypothetical protein